MAEKTLLVVLREAGEVGPVLQKLLATGSWEIVYAGDMREARSRVQSVQFLTHILCDMALADGYGHVLHQEAQDRHPRVRFVALRRAVPNGSAEEVSHYFAMRSIPVCNRPLKAEDVVRALTA